MIRCRLALVGILLVSLSACRTAPGPAPAAGVSPTSPPPSLLPVREVRGEPILRVRVAASIDTVTLDGPTRLRLRPLRDDFPENAVWEYAAPVTLVRRHGLLLMRSGQGGWLNCGAAPLQVESADGRPLRFDGVFYPQALVVAPVWTDRPGAPDSGDRVDVINHVGIESYLPGVLDKELYRSWHAQAFCAQAIAARSYALAQIPRSENRSFDVESTVASQAYGGLTANAAAREAATATRGMVLTWQGNVLLAFYSSTCGGTGQDAQAAFADGPDLPPLRGRFHGAWCSASPSYRWGPISVDRQVLAQRLAAWGRARRHPIGSLRDLVQIRATHNNAVGRPTWFAVHDSSGRSFPLMAEQFRFACNFELPGQGPPPASQLIKSSHVNVRLAGTSVIFEAGRGHGHGVGLCQWGAQGLAGQGYEYPAILAFYYPGSGIERAY